MNRYFLLFLFFHFSVIVFGQTGKISVEKPLEEMTFEEVSQTVKRLKLASAENRDCENLISLSGKAVEMAEKAYGPDDYLNFGKSIKELAHIHFSCGNAEEAFEILFKYIKNTGQNSAVTGSLLSFAGRLYGTVGNAKLELKYNLEGIEMIKNAVGKENYPYWHSLRYLASAYHKSGQYEKALELYL